MDRPLYRFDQLFEKMPCGSYRERNKALPIDWRHHDRIFALWRNNHPFVPVFDESCPKPGAWSRAAQEEAGFWFGTLGGGRWGESDPIGLRRAFL